MSIAFVNGAVLGLHHRGGKSVCTRSRSRAVPRACSEKLDQSSEWKMAGSGIGQSGLQEIEFIIRQDGMIFEKVTGVKGKDCVKLTAEIEKALGKVIHTEKTEEYHEKVVEMEKNRISEVIQPGDVLYVDDPNVSSW